jgi:hypothetical protein
MGPVLKIGSTNGTFPENRKCEWDLSLKSEVQMGPVLKIGSTWDLSLKREVQMGPVLKIGKTSRTCPVSLFDCL